MVFDFLGDRTKVAIAMAHIGALPGAPRQALHGCRGEAAVTALLDSSPAIDRL